MSSTAYSFQFQVTVSISKTVHQLLKDFGDVMYSTANSFQFQDTVSISTSGSELNFYCWLPKVTFKASFSSGPMSVHISLSVSVQTADQLSSPGIHMYQACPFLKDTQLQ